jgi:hypothetical protein
VVGRNWPRPLFIEEGEGRPQDGVTIVHRPTVGIPGGKKKPPTNVSGQFTAPFRCGLTSRDHDAEAYASERSAIP